MSVCEVKELAKSRPAYYPSSETAQNCYPPLVDQINTLGRGHVIAAYAYGSFFNGESKKSRPDFMLFVDDPKEFFRGHKRFSWWLQTRMNTISPNFYPGRMEIDGQLRGIKYAIIGYENFIQLIERGSLYTEGRFQKAAVVPLIRDTDDPRQANLDTAINIARFRGAWTTLAFVPKRFNYDQFAQEYVNLSYRADVRVEKKDKARIILDQSPEDYETMLGDILNAFVEAGILGKDQDSYEQRLTPDKKEVNALIWKSKFYAFGINYIKNWITFGPIKGLLYAGAKVLRSLEPRSLQINPPKTS